MYIYFLLFYFLVPVDTSTVKMPCKKGFELVGDICTPIQTSTVPETSSQSFLEVTTGVEKDLIQSIEISTVPTDFEPTATTDIVEVTTDLTTDNSVGTGGVDEVKGCPKGTKADDENACIPIDASTKIMIIDPKILLKNGSCPQDYKKVNDQCVYIEPEVEDPSYARASNMNIKKTNTLKQKDESDDEQTKIELVPELEDGTCPEGTMHSDNKLCKKLSLPTSVPKNDKFLNPKDFPMPSTENPSMLEANTIPVNTDNLFPTSTILTKS